MLAVIITGTNILATLEGLLFLAGFAAAAFMAFHGFAEGLDYGSSRKDRVIAIVVSSFLVLLGLLLLDFALYMFIEQRPIFYWFTGHSIGA